MKKKVSLFDNIETNTNKNNIQNNNDVKPENKEEIKPKLSIDNSGKKANINKMASRFESMLEAQKKEDERKSVHVSRPPPKKSDFASKISNLQNVLGGRISMGGNVFTMPSGGIKSISNVGNDIVHDGGDNNLENIKTEIKEISADNKNAFIEENKIQETSYEKQLEKKKESTVVVKKKKPKKIKFNSNENENNENKIEEKKENPPINNMFNFQNNNTQNQPTIQDKPKPKIDLFGDIKPKPQKASMNDLFADAAQSKPPITKNNLNNIFNNDNEQPKVSNLNKNNIIDFNDNNNNKQPDLAKPTLNMNNIFNEPPKSTQNNTNLNNNNNTNDNDKTKVPLNMNDIFNEQPKPVKPSLNMNDLFNDKPKASSNLNDLFNDKPKE